MIFYNKKSEFIVLVLDSLCDNYDSKIENCVILNYLIVELDMSIYFNHLMINLEILSSS